MILQVQDLVGIAGRLQQRQAGAAAHIGPKAAADVCSAYRRQIEQAAAEEQV